MTSMRALALVVLALVGVPCAVRSSSVRRGPDYTRGGPRRAGSSPPRTRRPPAGARSFESAGAVPTDSVYGVNPVLAALTAGRRPVHTLYLQDSLAPKARKDAAALERIVSLAERAGARIVRVDKGELNNMARNKPHQGLLLSVDALPEHRLAELPPVQPTEAGYPVWLALDEVQDPQNLGALLRSAHFLGASGVLVSARNSAPLSGATSKASAGAMEVMRVHSTTNLVSTLARSRANGWRVLGAALGSPSETVLAHEAKLHGPTVLVLGNEGSGLRTLVRRECDELIAIPAAPPGSADAFGAEDGWDADDETESTDAGVGARADDVDGDYGGGARGGFAVDSLNVSVAGAILLHQLLLQRHAAAGAQ